MTTDLQKLKATAQATAEKSPTLLVTVPAGVMVELIRDVERYRFLRDESEIRLVLGPFYDPVSVSDLDEAIDSEMTKEAQ